jgi:hypothetical protein
MDGKGLAGVADFIDEPVPSGDADAEPGRVGMRKLGNVVRDPTLRKVEKAGAQRLEVVEDRRGGHGGSF